MAKKKNKYQWDADKENALGDVDGSPRHPHTEEEQWQSRSQKKRDSTALQVLGEELVAMPLARAKKLPLTPELVEALTLMARIKDNEGRRRQKQYIGKLMRECDAEAVRHALQKMQQGHTQETAVFHRAERLRAALLDGAPAEQARVIGSLCTDETEADTLRALVERAREDVGAKRELFRYIHEKLQNK